MKSSDQAAFSELYLRYNKSVYAYLLKFVKAPELAEDLLHDVFLKFWDIREKLDIQVGFSAYLYRSCHNKAVTTLKRVVTEQDIKNQLIAHAGDHNNEAYSVAETFHKYDQLVETALSQLPAKRRQVFTLVRQEGKSYIEAAATLGISVNTLKNQLQLADQTIKRFIREKGEFVLVILLLEKLF